jgi:hypothetical protein
LQTPPATEARSLCKTSSFMHEPDDLIAQATRIVDSEVAQRFDDEEDCGDGDCQAIPATRGGERGVRGTSKCGWLEAIRSQHTYWVQSKPFCSAGAGEGVGSDTFDAGSSTIMNGAEKAGADRDKRVSGRACGSNEHE